MTAQVLQFKDFQKPKKIELEILPQPEINEHIAVNAVSSMFTSMQEDCLNFNSFSSAYDADMILEITRGYVETQQGITSKNTEFLNAIRDVYVAKFL